MNLPDKRGIDIVCPVFREEEGIAGFHARLAAAIASLESRYTVRMRYVIDPAPDRTEDVLRDLAAADPRVEVLVMSRRFGHQAALIAGIEASDADAVVMLDSDGQHPPELIPELVARWENGAQIVQTLRADAEELGYLKKATSRWFYRLLSRIGSVELRSGSADFRLLDRRVVEVLQSELPERNMFLRGLVTWIGFNLCYVPFEPAARQFGRSKYSASALFNFGLMGISSFSKAPLRLCTATGIVLAGLAVVGGIAQLLAYLVGDVAAPGWASLMLLTCFFGGIQLLFLGITGEYVGQIFDEVKRRPRYLVARRYGGDDKP